jgi:fructose-bisphosphate aldolase class II
MDTLRQIIKNAEKTRVAVGHFNISDCVALKAIFQAARELNLPVIIGVSEGEREFIGTKRIADAVKSIREEFNWPIYLNADHTHSLEKIKEAVEAGFDAVMFDGSKLSLEENTNKTKEVVDYIRSVNPEILAEGELGYIGGGSIILRTLDVQKLTKPAEAAHFVKETGVDLLAPAVGNLHGMFKDRPNPNLDIERIKEIRQAAGVPLVLHGGSGIRDEEFLAAIDAGVSVIHINTELRLAWREGMEKALKENPEEIAPYKALPVVVEEIKKKANERLKLFNRLK